MIELYGKRYAKNSREFTDSLFNPAGTANGFYMVTSAGIYLSDMQGKERAFIRRDGYGPVTVANHEGNRRYMFAASSLDESWLGVPDSYMAKVKGAEALAAQFFTVQQMRPIAG